MGGRCEPRNLDNFAAVSRGILRTGPGPRNFAVGPNYNLKDRPHNRELLDHMSHLPVVNNFIIQITNVVLSLLLATLKNDLSLHNLTYEDAIKMALDKPMWRLLAASGATH